MKKHHLLFILCLATLNTVFIKAQTVSYAYDMAGNRILRKIVSLNSNPSYTKQNAEDPAPIEELLGERTIKIYPNPTKGSLALEILGGNDKDQLGFILYNADGKQLQNKKVEPGTTPINMSIYPEAYYILRVMAGDKMTEFKIIKN